MMSGTEMQMSGWMMGGMGLISLLLVVFLITGIVYFVKNSGRR